MDGGKLNQLKIIIFNMFANELLYDNKVWFLDMFANCICNLLTNRACFVM